MGEYLFWGQSDSRCLTQPTALPKHRNGFNTNGFADFNLNFAVVVE